MVARNQWVRLSVVLLIALLARVALGAPLEIQASRPAPVEVSAGPGILLWSFGSNDSNSANGTVGNLGVLFGVSQTTPLSVGLDMGFGGLAVNPISNAAYLRMAPTAVYHFRSSDNPDITPFVGLSVGPNLSILNTDIAGMSVADTRVYLEILSRVGASIRLSQDLSLGLEVKAGVLNDYFLLSPGLTAGIAL